MNISASQFNGTQCKENCQQLKKNKPQKLEVHGKEGLEDCLLEVLLD